jgi:hypothetical protein
MLQHRLHRIHQRGAKPHRYKAHSTHAPACPARQTTGTLTPDQARALALTEQAAYDAHSAAYAAWQAEPANTDRQTALSATYRAWQIARLVCLRAKVLQPDLFPQFRS